MSEELHMKLTNQVLAAINEIEEFKDLLSEVQDNDVHDLLSSTAKEALNTLRRLL